MSGDSRPDLDYCLTFPTLTNEDNTQEDHRDEFVFVYDDDKRPVVVLLGWAGCQDKYLAKYSAIYEEKSCITLRYIAPVECLFWRQDKLPHIGRHLIQILSEQCLQEHPIFFHVFSNGGAFLYQHVSRAIEQSNSEITVKGVIFDSAPGERRVTTLFKAISAILGGNIMSNIPFSFLITTLVSLLWLYEIVAHAWGKAHLVQTNPMSLSEEPHSWPQLFLYSNADTLIPAVDVEKFATRRAERGVHVQLVLFTDSPHVKHYAMYRDVYVNTVCSFIHECLTDTTDSVKNSLSTSNIDKLSRSSTNEIDDDSIQLQTLGLTKRVVATHEAFLDK